MLNIAFIAQDYKSGKMYLEAKFKDKIEKINLVKRTYTLKNGDVIHLIYDSPDSVKSYDFDAYLISANYETLENVVKYRCMR